MFAPNLQAISLVEQIKKIFSVNISEDIFDSINESIVGSLHAKNLQYKFPNKVSMDDVEVLDEKGGRILYAKHADLSVSLISLLTSNIVITNAVVDSPFFRYTIEKSIHNVIQVFDSVDKDEEDKNDKKKSRLRVTISSIEVDNGNYEMEHDVGLTIFASGIKARGNFWVEQGPFEVNIEQAEIKEGGISIAGMYLPITNLVSKNLFISDKKVSTSRLVADYEKASLSAEGTVYIKNDKYDINASLNAPVNTYPMGLKKLPFNIPSFVANVSMMGPLTDPLFDIESRFGSTDFNGLKINYGNASAVLNSSQLLVKQSQFNVGKNGLIKADGDVNFETKNYSFNSEQKKLPVEDFIKFVSLDYSSNGLINASTKLSGKIDSLKEPMQIETKGVISAGEIGGLSLHSKTEFESDLELFLENKLVFKQLQIMDQKGLKLNTSGLMYLNMEQGFFNFEIGFDNIKPYIHNAVQNNILSEKIALLGKISWLKNKFDSEGMLIAKKIAYEKAFVSDLEVGIEVLGNEIKFNGLQANLGAGRITGNAKANWQDQTKLAGELELLEVDLNSLFVREPKISIDGKVSANISLSGDVKNPRVGFKGVADQVEIDKVSIKNNVFDGVYFDDKIVVNNLLTKTHSGLIEARDLSYGIKSEEISGSFMLSDINIPAILFRYLDNVSGIISGMVDVGGTLKEPQIYAPLKVEDFSIQGHSLGSGPMSISFKQEKLISNEEKQDLVFTLSSLLRNKSASSNIRLAYALLEKSINAQVYLDDVFIDTANIKSINEKYPGLKGEVYGFINAFGPVDSLIIDSHLELSKYKLFDRSKNEKHSEEVWIDKPAVISTSLRNGLLQIELCAPWSSMAASKNCILDQGISLAISGPFSLEQYDLKLKARLLHNNLEEILFYLSDEFIRANIDLSLAGSLSKISKKDEPQLGLEISVDHFAGSLPNIPKISIENPIKIYIVNNKISIPNDAAMDFFPGQLIFSGGFKNGKLDAKLSGAIPLLLAKYFVPNIQRGQGLAVGDLRLKGPINKIIAEGFCNPEAGSTLSFKKWLESVEFKSGRISFKKLARSSFSTIFEDIKMNIGDGKMSINGLVNKKYGDSFGDPLFSFDVQVEGSGVVLKEGNNFVESDFVLNTIKSGSESSILTGKFTVTDGLIYRQFDLRNFVLEAVNESEFNKVEKLLNNIDLMVNVDFNIRQFKTYFRVLNIETETSVSGQLKMLGPLRRPKLSGGVSATDGSIHFPAVTFDLSQSRIELDELSPKILDPKIDILSTQDLPKDVFPQLAQDTTVQISLKGNLDRLVLELKPISGDMRISQSKLFPMLLLPRSIAASGTEKIIGIPQEAKNAVLAFSGEVFLRPITNELQELFGKSTGTKIQFGSALEPGGGINLRLNWQIGPRIELDGTYAFLGEDFKEQANIQNLYSDDYSFRDLKMKFLLFDHKPWGPSALELAFGANRYVDEAFESRAKIRLSYRILYK